MNPLLRRPSRLFDHLNSRWEGFLHRRALGLLLVVVFLGSLAVIELRRLGLLPAGLGRYITPNHFGAVEVAFNLLLVLEILALVFALAQSVADSVGKQFELLSLILLRKAFLEFGHFGEPVEWARAEETVLVVLADIVGALLIFVVIGVFYRVQRHRPITASEEEQASFVAAKKGVALALVAAFAVMGLADLRLYLLGERTFNLFHAFYTVLIFSDILIVLIALAYTSEYQIVFRNSGFAAATLIIRLALTAPPYVNSLLGVGAALLVVGLSLAYNAFARTLARTGAVP